MGDTTKDVREFWKEKVRSVERSKMAVTKYRPHGFASGSGKNVDKVDEAKRRTNEELAEVLRQTRQSSNSPEPSVTSSISRSRPVRTIGIKESPAHELNPRDFWKRSTVAASRMSAGSRSSSSSPTGDHRNASSLPAATPSPYKVMCTRESPTVANKMAERIDSLKKVAVKPHPPLRPASSEDNDKQTPRDWQLALKKRPFSTSAFDINNSQQDHEKSHFQANIDKVLYSCYHVSLLPTIAMYYSYCDCCVEISVAGTADPFMSPQYMCPPKQWKGLVCLV